MECLNNKCDANKEGQCINYMITSEKEKCVGEIRHTPNYAEEQLEYAKENKIRCYDKGCGNNKDNKCTLYCDSFSCLDRIAEPINYEEETRRKIESINKLCELLKEELNKTKLDLKRYQDEWMEQVIELNKIKETLKDKNKYIEELQVSHNIIEQENSELIYKNEELVKALKILTNLLSARN